MEGLGCSCRRLGQRIATLRKRIEIFLFSSGRDFLDDLYLADALKSCSPDMLDLYTSLADVMLIPIPWAGALRKSFGVAMRANLGTLS